MDISRERDSSSSDQSEQLLVWVTLDHYDSHVEKDCSTNSHFNPAIHATRSPWFEESNIKELKKALGTHYASCTNKISALHQGIVTTEVLRHQYLVRIVYKNSPQESLQYLSIMDHADKKDTLVWLDAYQDVYPHGWMFAYDILTNECGSIFPPREEIVWADFMVYDMQALDRIAADYQTYRPLMCCPTTRDHTCHLDHDLKTVFKRSHSCSAQHVRVVKAGGRGRPACEKLPVDKDDVLADGFYRWMHQEYVQSLVTFGEFRVFIVTRNKEDGKQEPLSNPFKKPMCIEQSDWVVAYDAEEALPGDKWKDYPKLDYEKLVDYALHAYQRLQESGEVGFQSLDVGGRLDIGIAPSGEEFFVNELTRWFGAHHFALHAQKESKPGDEICRALAKAFAAMRGLSSRDNIEEVTVAEVAKEMVVKKTAANRKKGRQGKVKAKTPIAKSKSRKKRARNP